MARTRPGADQRHMLDPEGRFADRLVADREAIASLSQAGDHEELRAVVHRLAGAAGTFGFDEVGDLAIAIDDILAAGGTASMARIGRLLAALDRAATAHNGSA